MIFFKKKYIIIFRRNIKYCKNKNDVWENPSIKKTFKNAYIVKRYTFFYFCIKLNFYKKNTIILGGKMNFFGLEIGLNELSWLGYLIFNYTFI